MTTPAPRSRLTDEWKARVIGEIQDRYERIKTITGNPHKQEIIRRYLASGPDGLIAFASDWVWTIDPRNRRLVDGLPRRIPMCLWPEQEELLRTLYDSEMTDRNLLIVKSRDVGASWLIAGVYFVWRWLFEPDWSGTIGSYKQSVLDSKDDPDSIFEKMRHVIRELPEWLRPVPFKMELNSSFCKIYNPQNKSVISGVSGPQAGRSGRSSMVLLDEFGSLPHPQSVEAAMSANTNCLIYCDTPKPPGSYLYELHQSGRVNTVELSIKDDPRRPPGYIDMLREEYPDHVIDMEYLLRWDSGTEGSFIPPAYVQAAIDFQLSGTKPVVAGVDVADEGDNESVLVIRRGNRITHVQSWSGIDPVELGHKACDVSIVEGVTALRFDSIGVGAGMRGALNQRSDLPFSAQGVNVGNAPTSVRFSDLPSDRPGDRFANLKAQLWWAVRLRFHKTWQRANGEDVPEQDCISIPNDPVLIRQLSAPRFEHTETGKIRVESKKSMARRGAESPDRADALILAFATEVETPSMPNFARA